MVTWKLLKKTAKSCLILEMSLVIKKIVPLLSAIVGNKVVMAFGQITYIEEIFWKKKGKKQSC